VIEEGSPGWEELHSAPRAREERRADLVLEGADLAAHRRLGDPEPLGSSADMALLGNSDEVADLREAHGPIVQRLCSRGKRSGEIETVLDVLQRPRKRSAMAIEILTRPEIERMRRAGRVAAETLAFIHTQIRPGITTADIDRWVREDTARRGGRPSQLGYKGFPAAVCTSKNDVVCHGIPSVSVRLEAGDIVNVDVTTNLDGYHGDTSATFVVGEASAEALRLVEVARRCRDAGVAVVRDGARLGDIGAAIEELAKREGVSIVTELGGHGIGRRMHADPHVGHTGRRGSGPRLKAGMAITIEPMVNLGAADVSFLDDGWTVVTADGSLSAQFEHTVIVTPDGCEITTLLT
jgi:methionyl aminopeptidase